MKKAQMAGQIFIYVLAIVIFGLTLIYGYKAIAFLSERTGEISFIQFENDIKQEIARVQSDTKGTIKKKVLDVPGGYDAVCFAKSSLRTGPSTSAYLSYPLIQNALSTGVESNMFLWPPGDVAFNIGDIELIPSADPCINLTGTKVTLRLESMGTHVKVSQWG